MAEARVFKRNSETCDAIMDLYNQNELFVSFEVAIGTSIIENGVRVVDAHESNNLIGLCLVSRPAYQNASAVYLAAEQKDKEVRYLRATENSTLRLADAETIIGEATFETITRMIYESVASYVGEMFYDMSFLNIGMTSALLYHNSTGQMFTAIYIIRQDGIYVSEFYPSMVIRAEDETQEVEHEYKESEVSELDKELTNQIEEVVVDTAEQTTEEVTEEIVADEVVIDEVTEDVVEEIEETVEAEEEVTQEQVEEPVVEVAVSELEKTVAEQAKRIAELEEVEKQLSAIKAEEAKAVIAETRDKLSQFAKKAGLDTSNEMVASVLEELNYEKFVHMLLESQPKKGPAVQIAESTVNHMTDKMSIKGSWLFQK